MSVCSTAASKGNYDIYVVFVERGLQLLTRKGRLGFILPHKFFNAQYGEPLRGLIAEGRHLEHVVHFGHQQVFDGATTYTCLMFLDKEGTPEAGVTKVGDMERWKNDPGEEEAAVISTSSIHSAPWNFSFGMGRELVEKLCAFPKKLDEVADVFVGVQTSADDVFILDVVKQSSRTITLHSKALACDWTFEKGLLFPLASGTDVGRYRALEERQCIIFPYRVEDGKANLVGLAEMAARYPSLERYLSQNRKRLEGRENGKLKGRDWHGYIYLKNMARQCVTKLCVPRLVSRLCATYDFAGTHVLDNVDVGGVVLREGYRDLGLPYLLGLLNSQLLGWYFPHVSAPFRGGWMSANRQFLSQLPIRTIDFADRHDRARHDKMVALVEQMLTLHRDLAVAKTAHDKILVERQIAATDKQIDRLVYELYGLTEEEIAVVEGGA